MRFRFPFVRRIAIFFLLMATLVSAVFSFAIVLIVHHVEEHLVSEKLREDLNIILASNTDVTLAQLNSDTHFYSSLSPEHSIPEYLRLAPIGFSQIVNDEEAYYVFNRKHGNVQYLLVQDQHVLEARERLIYQAVFGCFLFIVLVAWILGRRIAKRIMLPVSMLAKQVQQRCSQDASESFLADDYANDEIGNLAASFDKAFNRVRSALERERLFTSDVSHELRTPLMVITTSCELLREMKLTEIQQQQLEKISAATIQIKELVETFLNLARDGEDRKITGNSMTVTEMVNDLEPGVRELCQNKGLKFNVIRRADNRHQHHAVFLRAVMLNLLHNAIHYTATGSVTLVLEEGKFRVEDSGPGIEEHEKPRLFQPFQRGNDVPGEGLGLGLSLVKRICEHSNWQIDVSHRRPQGTIFTVNIG